MTKINKSFCVAPWLTVMTSPSGVTHGCCVWGYKFPTGDLKKQTIEEVATSPLMNDVRKRMLNGETLPECSSCDGRDLNSGSHWSNTKNSYNSLFRNEIPSLIENTNADGSLKTPFKMKIMNTRFNNLCNYGCRSCNPILSSLIADEDGIPSPTVLQKNVPNIMDQVLERVPEFVNLNLAGGEPMLLAEHWKILDRLVELGKRDVQIEMYTNLSKIKYLDRDLIEKSKFFGDQLLIHCSIDAFGKRAEVYRHGTNWNNVESNLRKLIENNCRIEFNTTIGATNVWHLPDLHRYFIDQGYINKSNHIRKMRINSLTYPSMLSTKIIPHESKLKIRDRLLSYNESLRSEGLNSNVWKDISNFMLSEDHSFMLPKFIQFHKEKDAIRGQNIFKTFPEIQDWCTGWDE